MPADRRPWAWRRRPGEPTAWADCGAGMAFAALVAGGCAAHFLGQPLILPAVAAGLFAAFKTLDG